VNTAKKLQEENTFLSPMPSLPRLLRSAVVYGLNAAGKSKLIQAVAFMKRFVLSSAKESQEGERIDVKPFLFKRESSRNPSEFQVVFIQDGIRYQYGFAVNPEKVTGEWLFEYPETRAQKWFEWNYDSESQKESWYFGPKFTSSRKTWQGATRCNALFLSTAIQLHNEQLKPVFNWFDKKLVALGELQRLSPDFSIHQCEEADKKSRIFMFMNSADLSVADISLQMEEFYMEDLSDNMPQNMKEQIAKDLKGKR
jgi:hypothetical protein